MTRKCSYSTETRMFFTLNRWLQQMHHLHYFLPKFPQQLGIWGRRSSFVAARRRLCIKALLAEAPVMPRLRLMLVLLPLCLTTHVTPRLLSPCRPVVDQSLRPTRNFSLACSQQARACKNVCHRPGKVHRATGGPSFLDGVEKKPDDGLEPLNWSES